MSMDAYYSKHIRNSTLGGAAIGGLIGAAKGHQYNRIHSHDLKKDDRPGARKKHLLTGGLVGAAVGGAFGHGFGRVNVHAHKQHAKWEDELNRRYQERQHRNSGGSGDWNYHSYSKTRSSVPHDDHLKTIGLTGKEKTKKEVNNAYRNLAKKHHPDVGGDAIKMKKINDAYDNIKKSDWHEKLGFANGFSNV